MGVIKNAIKWIAISIGGLIALLFIALMAFGAATEVGIFPSTLVQTGVELPEKQYEALREAKILDRNEVVKFYYAEGMFDVTYSGSILTDKRILGYWTEEEKDEAEIKVLSYNLKDIDYLELTEEGDSLTDAMYQVTIFGNSEDSLILYLSVEEDRHLEMVEALEKQIAENTSRFAETEN